MGETFVYRTMHILPIGRMGGCNHKGTSQFDGSVAQSRHAIWETYKYGSLVHFEDRIFASVHLLYSLVHQSYLTTVREKLLSSQHQHHEVHPAQHYAFLGIYRWGCSFDSPRQHRPNCPTVRLDLRALGKRVLQGCFVKVLSPRLYQSWSDNLHQVIMSHVTDGGTGYNADYYTNLQYIAHDEEQHVKLLSGALTAAGVTPVQACTYSFPYTDVQSFITLSSVLEGVGTSAYLGGAPLITSKDYLSVAGAILVSEALHTSLQRGAAGEVPFANPYGTVSVS